MFSIYGSIILFILFVQFDDAAVRLNEYISHYETLNYDRQELAQKHSRAKRSVINRDSHVHLQFFAHDRDFHLRLKRDLNTFSDNLVIVDSDNKPFNSTEVDTSHIYAGYLVGEPDSVVYGSVLDGVFEGKITSPKSGSYYVEKSTRYFPDHYENNGNETFHSIVYKETDIDNPHNDKYAGCGVMDEVKKWMESIQTSAIEDDDDKPPSRPAASRRHADSMIDRHPTDKKEQTKKKNRLENLDPENYFYEVPHKKYSKETNVFGYRAKRAVRPKEKDKNTCSLFIQTDPLIWRHINQQVNGDLEKTKEEILSLIAHHITAVNYIYRDTKFDGRIEHRNIKFEVQRIKIDDNTSCNPHSFEYNPFCMENIDVSNFLNLHSLGNHEDFCLAYVFTYRDFTGGTLGLAWVASATGASGGICEKYKTYTETIAGLYQSTKRSLNTGIITFVNYNTRVPPKVSQLTLAHEIGHNFGSPHDYPADCRPGGLTGNYIMFASATSGDRPNNSKFSTCSVGNISSVLDSIEDNKKRNCFKSSEGAFCGNKIVEEGEECDCGYDDNECSDRCCYPKIISHSDRIRNETAKGCTRRSFAECSPSQGPCCVSNSCVFVNKSVGQVCKPESDCSRSSVCNGSSSECPVPQPKSDKTRCNEGTQLCVNGECRGSICLSWNLNGCFLSSNNVPHADKRKLCELACMNGTNPSTCRSTSEFASTVGLPPGGISLRPGSPCDNFQGYCDVFLKCRPVDGEGPLARLKNIIFNKNTLNSLQQWAMENWWLCLLAGFLFILFMIGFIKCCAVHTPSSNPKKAPARRFSETLRDPMTTLRRIRGQRARPRDDNNHQPHVPNHDRYLPRSSLNQVPLHSNRGSDFMMIPQNQQPPPPYSESPNITAAACSSSGAGAGGYHHQSRRSSHHCPRPASAPSAAVVDMGYRPSSHKNRNSKQYKR